LDGLLLAFEVDMNKWLSIFCTFLISTSVSATEFREDDKEKHMQACAGISMISYGAFRAANFGRFSSSLMSFSMAMAVGHFKETQDRFYDQKDMEANALGATMGIIIPMGFTF